MESKLTLAIENSSARASLALLQGRERLAEHSYEPRTRDQESILAALKDLLRQQKLACADIGLYVVGRGPGNYTGLRISMAMAQALALPGRDELVAVSSGAALAQDTLQRENADRVAVIGDARRQQYWMGLFTLQDGLLEAEGDWQLFDEAELKQALPEGTVATSPEMDRLRERLPCEQWSNIRWIEENRYPSAALLAEIALVRREHGLAMEPLDILYMHPPV